jgi:GT2 family glycosyltransferase
MMPAINVRFGTPRLTICVLTFGDHPWLAHRVIESIRAHCRQADYRLIVGANAVADETAKFLAKRHEDRGIDELIVSPTNLNKCPMMRRMFDKVNTDFIWWFDDDSYITEPTALAAWMDHAANSPPETVMWGELKWCDSAIGFTYLNERATLDFVRSANWYRGLPPPSWRLGGKGEFNFRGLGTGDGRWDFVTGGCWMIRTSAVRALGWPDPRLVKMGDDAFLGEAIRQQGWAIMDIGSPGVAISAAPRRGDPG